MRTASWLSLSGILLVGAIAACSGPTDDESGSGTSGVTERAFQKDDLLDDATLRDVDAMSVAKVQAFLDKTPYKGTKSVLADYTEDGKSAAEILVSASQKHDINPLALLVRAQMEQGLISKKTAPDATIAIALGCACPESPMCSDKYRGFAAQADCAAGTLSRSMERATTSKGTASGWARYRSKATEDGIKITPKNSATAALYTYTPWVGEAGGGKKGVGGASLHFQVWTRFAEALAYKPAGGNSDDDTTDPLKSDGGGADARTATDAGSAPDASDPMDPPATDAGAPTPTTDAGSAPSADGGATPSGEEEGADDDEILTGNAPPTTNAAPPRSSSSSRSGSSSSSSSGAEGEDEASAEDLDTAKKSESSGCSTTGGRGGGGDALLIAGAALAAAIGGRRRRR